METKHTPGPWVVLPGESRKPYLRVRGTCLGERYEIANVLAPAYDDAPPREAEETRANASLIAAAPELLEALESIVSDAWENGAYWDKARAAIAKARGETC